MPPAESIPVMRMIEVHPGAGSANMGAYMALSSMTRIHTLRAMSGGSNASNRVEPRITSSLKGMELFFCFEIE